MNTNPAGAVTPDTRPRAGHASIASCPTCGADLVDEAFSLWCTQCQAAVSFASVIALGGDS